MTRRCTICTHPDRHEIDRALVNSEGPERALADKFGVSRSALQRHRANHLPAHLVKAKEAAEVASADDLLGRLLALNHETAQILREARQVGDNELALKAIARAERQLELQARLVGELQDDQQTVNVLVSPQWVQMRAVLMATLEPFPQARASLARALETLDSDRQSG